MNAARAALSQRLQELGVEERGVPGRDDGFASLFFRGKEFAHFHHWSEIDIRLGKAIIRRENLQRAAPSKVHPDRAATSPWYEMPVCSDDDVAQVVRLVTLALQELAERK